MARLSLRTAFTALALGVAALSGGTLAAAPAEAHGFHGGGWGHHHGHGGWGYRPVRVVPVVSGGYGGCVVKRIERWDGTVVIKKRCY